MYMYIHPIQPSILFINGSTPISSHDVHIYVCVYTHTYLAIIIYKRRNSLAVHLPQIPPHTGGFLFAMSLQKTIKIKEPT